MYLTNHTRRNPLANTPGASPWLMALLLASTAVLADEDKHNARERDDAARGPCSTTARLAYQACRNDVRDNYFLQLGKCQNEAQRDRRNVCNTEAKKTRDEARSLCGEQRVARLEICALVGEAPYDPAINSADFLSPEQTAMNPNPWFPLVPGTIRVYRAGDETTTVTVTADTRILLGVTTLAVRDVVTRGGVPIEDTTDWYAQDLYGNVWYFGEVAQNFDQGILTDLDGSWAAGVDGAKPGIQMPAAPQVGDVYRQEFLLAEAEDMAQVRNLHASASVAAEGASCSGNCLQTREFLPLEPDAVEFKFYTPGVGHILTLDANTGEREELVELIRP